MRPPSDSSCITTAVEERAKAAPSTMEVAGLLPNQEAIRPITVPVTST